MATATIEKATKALFHPRLSQPTKNDVPPPLQANGSPSPVIDGQAQEALSPPPQTSSGQGNASIQLERELTSRPLQLSDFEKLRTLGTGRNMLASDIAPLTTNV